MKDNQKKYKNAELFHTDRREYPVTQQFDARHARLVSPFAQRVGRHVKVLLPGLDSDGGSVPRLLWWFQSPFTGVGTAGFWGHDGDYKARGVFKVIADFRMFVTHIRYKMNPVKAFLIFLAVLFGGWWAWEKSPKEDTHVLYFDVSQTEEIKLALRKGKLLAGLMAEQRRPITEERKAMLERDKKSLLNGDIDEFLKKEARR